MEMNAIPDGFRMTELGMLPEEWVELKMIAEEIMEVKRRIAGYWEEVKYGQ